MLCRIPSSHVHGSQACYGCVCVRVKCTQLHTQPPRPPRPPTHPSAHRKQRKSSFCRRCCEKKKNPNCFILQKQKWIKIGKIEQWRSDQSREFVVFPVGLHSRDVGFHLGLLALSIRLLAETCGSATWLELTALRRLTGKPRESGPG